MTVSAEMPKYRCHKVVHALRIDAIEIRQDGSATIAPKDNGFASFAVNADWVSRFKGDDHWDTGYYVVYEDGYESWSPTEVFEKGYTRLGATRAEVLESLTVDHRTRDIHSYAEQLLNGRTFMPHAMDCILKAVDAIREHLELEPLPRDNAEQKAIDATKPHSLM